VVLGVLRLVLVVLVVLELRFFCILNDHTFHDLQCPLHGRRIKRIFLGDLDYLRCFLVLSTRFYLLFHLLAQVLLVLAHVGIEDHPLCGFNRVIAGYRRVRLVAFLTNGQIEGLRGALLIKELVTQRNSLRNGVSLQIVLPKLLDDLLVHLREHLLISTSLGVAVILLIASFIRLLQQDVAVHCVVHYQVFVRLFGLEAAVLAESKPSDVDSSLGV